ncbi:PepSY-associated TM helix domain-containing protein [Tenacibaculum xiamenense]|uniref:PepSY-associated TM helix domain-containing protein n=1 Tax=Tenacibaculum xiamenense TaxID=1261553 RepID=UPI0038935EFF
MKNFKKISRSIHEWLGITSGLIVFIVSLSGTLFVFCDEVISISAGEAKYVQYDGTTNKKSFEELLNNFNEKYPERELFYFDDYKDSNRSFRIASHKKLKDFTFTYANPYTGEFIKDSRSYWVFFYIAAKIHSQILLNKTGQTIVGISTIIFFFELITGLILWFPKRWNKKSKQASFTIKKGTKWKRKVYDLHKVLGFYVLIPALLITVTGLIMSFKILNDVTQEVFGGTPNGHELAEKYYPKFEEGKQLVSLNTIVNNLYLLNPTSNQVRIGFPFSKETKPYYFGVAAEEIGLKTWKNGHAILINGYTGYPLEMPEKIAKHEVIEQTIFDLHCGFWMGMTGKIITFLSGLICTSLPVTGFIFWFSRKRKRKTSKKHQN